MIKKILKWTGVTLLVLVVLLIASPFLFKDKIKALVLKSINEKVDATVAALTGTSDMNISGTVDNFYGFLFNNQDLKGNFVLNSNQLVVADFLSSDSSATSTNSSSAASVKIPAF
ncbi:MAG: hypothetical protein ACO3HC_06820, partial [Flavobacteriaceae bacterium]